MARFALYPNDAGVTLLEPEKVVYRQPGFALLDGQALVIGNAAFEKARIDPRGIQHRYWSALSVEPLGDRRFAHLAAADLASRQLEDLWAEAGDRNGSVVVAVPAYLSKESLGLLLGICAELGIPVAGMVDAAVAATRREYVNAVPVHIEMGLHAATLTRLGQSDGASVEQADVLDDCGVYSLYDTWIRVIAEAFVQQSRFDPLHAAETEQLLLDQLARWLADASHQQSVVLELEYGGLAHRAEIETLTLVNAAAPVYQSIASRLRALYRAGETPALQLTDRVARLPGLAEHLKARLGGEVFTLEAGATARGALARLKDARPGSGGVSLRRQLPWDQSAFTVDIDDAGASDTGAPTHLLFHNTAYAIGAQPLVLGSQAGDGERVLVLDGEMPGLSRRHCSVAIADGRCVVEDFSRYGTFLNGHRISGSTVLQVGDSLRIGAPGFEFRLITTDESHGA
jgi:hypothetical protein